jgi:hypothetical protein
LSEKNELNKIMLDAPDNRILFRNNTGVGWTGDVIERGSGILVLKNPRPLNAGLCKGSSDLIGWEERVITPEMVEKKIAVFVAIEVKTGRVVATEDQKNFLQQVAAAGGIAELLRV